MSDRINPASHLWQRRRFFQQTGAGLLGLQLLRLHAEETSGSGSTTSFFVVGDTHYCASDSDASVMDPISAAYNRRLVDWLNRLPGTEFPVSLGAGKVPIPDGVIHLGDVVENGDKGPTKFPQCETERDAFVRDWGLNGDDGVLRWPVREIHGNHDAPQGDTPMVKKMIERTKSRKGLLSVCPRGLHYSWDWHGVHFVALGIVAGDAASVTRKRRYAPLGSLEFLKKDLAEHVGDSGKPVVLLHHVDVHRYSKVVPDDVVKHSEWDYGDAHAFYEIIKPYRVAACMCGHTHVRKVMRWNGTPDQACKDGVPFVNTDNAAHFGSPVQAFLHIEINDAAMTVREFSTDNGWEQGKWNDEKWVIPLPKK